MCNNRNIVTMIEPSTYAPLPSSVCFSLSLPPSLPPSLLQFTMCLLFFFSQHVLTPDHVPQPWIWPPTTYHACSYRDPGKKGRQNVLILVYLFFAPVHVTLYHLWIEQGHTVKSVLSDQSSVLTSCRNIPPPLPPRGVCDTLQVEKIHRYQWISIFIVFTSHMIQSHTRYRCTALWVEMQFNGCDFRLKVGQLSKHSPILTHISITFMHAHTLHTL